MGSAVLQPFKDYHTLRQACKDRCCPVCGTPNTWAPEDSGMLCPVHRVKWQEDHNSGKGKRVDVYLKYVNQARMGYQDAFEVYKKLRAEDP